MRSSLSGDVMLSSMCCVHAAIVLPLVTRDNASGMSRCSFHHMSAVCEAGSILEMRQRSWFGALHDSTKYEMNAAQSASENARDVEVFPQAGSLALK